MLNEKNRRVESYLLGKMSATERRQFEQDLTTDMPLADALNTQQMEHDVLEAMVEMDLFSEMNAWKAEAEATEQKRTKTVAKTAKVIPFYRRYSTLAIAASFLLLVGAAFWLLRPTDNVTTSPPVAEIETPVAPSTPIEETPTDNAIAKDDNKKAPPTIEETPTKDTKTSTPKTVTPTPSAPNYLAAIDNYANPLQLGTVRSSDTATEGLAAALDDLKNGELAKGVGQLTILVTENPTNLDAQYYLGLAQYQRKNYNAVIAPLSAVSADAFYLENEKAQWYLILAYLQTGQLEEAKGDLQKILSDSEHSYYQAAVKLSAKM